MLVAVKQPAEVGDALRGFEGEAEGLGGLGEPVGGLLWRGQLGEGVVHFDRVEPGGVEAEELFGGDGFGVKAGFPCGIRPARGAGEEVAGCFGRLAQHAGLQSLPVAEPAHQQERLHPHERNAEHDARPDGEAIPNLI